MCSRAKARSIRRRLDPPREQQRVRPICRLAGLGCRLEGPEDPLSATTVAEHDPRPSEPVDDLDGPHRVVLAGPGQRGVDVGAFGPGEREVFGLPAAAYPLVDEAAASANQAAWAARARSAIPASVIASIAKARMLSRSRYRTAAASSSSSTITSERPASRPTTSIAAAVGTSSASMTNSTAGRRAPPENVASAQSPRWSSGNRSS